MCAKNITKNTYDFPNRKTYPLKLNLTGQQKIEVDILLEEYSNVINYVLGKTYEIILPQVIST